MDKFVHIVDITNEWIGKALSCVVLPLALLIVVGVVARYGFKTPLISVHEIALFIFGGYMILGAADVHAKNGHVSVEIFYQRFSKKTRAVLDICTAPFFLFFSALVLWEGGIMFWLSFSVREQLPTAWAPPVYPYKIFVPISGFLLFMQGLSRLVRDFRIAKNPTVKTKDLELT